ncbi:MAG: hypothetical protein ORO03_01575 [Alphaproteobacteria bacterium]|nr:hypothetical protein [Alphaproteobacteria bacterium]
MSPTPLQPLLRGFRPKRRPSSGARMAWVSAGLGVSVGRRLLLVGLILVVLWILVLLSW